MDEGLRDAVRRWQAGWGLCRGLGPAEERDGGLVVRLGQPARDREIFVLDDDALGGLIGEALRAARPTWLTVTTRAPEDAYAVLKRAGLDPFDEVKALMAIELAEHPEFAAPSAYDVQMVADGQLLRATVRYGGEVAAYGMAAVVGADAVVHDVQTAAAHRRRGLGRVVMSALARAARERGARTGLLMATVDGQGLYTALGWSSLADMVTARLNN